MMNKKRRKKREDRETGSKAGSSSNATPTEMSVEEMVDAIRGKIQRSLEEAACNRGAANTGKP